MVVKWKQNWHININNFNKYSSENDIKRELADMLSIQDELVQKLSKKEEEISKLKMERDIEREKRNRMKTHGQ